MSGLFLFLLRERKFSILFSPTFPLLFTQGRLCTYRHENGHAFSIYKRLNLVFEYAQKSSLQQSDVRLCVPLQYMEILVTMRTRLLLCWGFCTLLWRHASILPHWSSSAAGCPVPNWVALTLPPACQWSSASSSSAAEMNVQKYQMIRIAFLNVVITFQNVHFWTSFPTIFLPLLCPPP